MHTRRAGLECAAAYHQTARVFFLSLRFYRFCAAALVLHLYFVIVNGFFLSIFGTAMLDLSNGLHEMRSKK